MIEKLKKFVATIWSFINTVSGMWLWGWLGGRTFVFIMCSLGAMVWLAHAGKLENNLIAGLGVLAGLFTARAVADDYVQFKHKTLEYVPPGAKPPEGGA